MADPHYKLVPKGLLDNLQFRRQLLRSARRARREQDALREACRRDCLFFINTFVWQVNPRKKGGNEVGPFITWPIQDELVAWILERIRRDRDGLIEKSREMGASWINLIVMDWLALFHPWQKFLCFSHTEDAVDKLGDMDSLFEKVNYIHGMLPPWLVGDVERKRLALAYPNRSAVTGQASTVRSGVGGRATAIFLDEFAKQRDDWAILGQTADTSGSRIFNSTHYGTGTAYFDLCDRAKRGEIDHFVLHWSHHPEKSRGLYRWSEELKRIEVLDKSYESPPDYPFVTDGSPHGGPFPNLRSPWYDAECKRRRSSRDIAMHLDIDPQGATSQFCEPILIRQLVEEFACAPQWRGDLLTDQDTAEPLGLAQAPGGPLRLWLKARPDGSMPAGKYVIGADIAQGTGATPSSASIFDAAKGEKVGRYSSNTVDAKDFGLVAVSLCQLFTDAEGRPAKLIWEMQGPGLSFAQRVLGLGFRNIYYRQAEQPTNMKVTVSYRPGWVPTPESKDLLLADYRDALYKRRFINHDQEAVEEFLEFAYDERGNVEHQKSKSNDPSATRQNHGDHVVADALAWKEGKALKAAVEQQEEAEPPVGSFSWRKMLAQHQDAQRRRW